MAAPPPPYAQAGAPPPAAYPPAGQYPPPGQYPPAGAPAPVVVVAAQPVHFGRYPVNMTCNNCHAQIQTAVNYQTGLLTWILVAVLFFTTGFCCWIPFLIDACKDAVHTCPSCRAFIGKKEALS